MKPKIAITARSILEPNATYPVIGVRKPYLDAIIQAGGVPVIIPLVQDKDALRAALDLTSGLLLPGGEDVLPSYYGEEAHPLLRKTDALRDEVELFAINWARQKHRPILGICRGIQILNVAYGGTLYQDIDEQRNDTPAHKESNWDELSHPINLEGGSLLSKILCTECLSVNSLHHQAIKDLGAGLKATATSADGLIEGVESTDHRHFVVGIQCHPEALWQEKDARWLKLFEAFISASGG